MSATFSSHIRGFSANTFVDSLKNIDYPEWKPATTFAIGNIVFYGSRKYICGTTTGVSGNTPPTHLIGKVSDGNLDWIFVETLYDLNNNYKNNIYLFYGKRTQWTNELSPDVPRLTDIELYKTTDDIFALKKITPSKCKLATRKYSYVSGTIYSQYDSSKNPFSIVDYPTPFYVLNSEGNIYKCINNNNGVASLSEPYGVSLNHIITGDGYVWFYMGTLSSTNSLLTSNEFIAIDTKTYNDGSNQWLVQENAKPKSISTFKIIKTNGTFVGNTTTTVFGDGTDATAITRLNDLLIPSTIIVDNPGINYNYENTYCVVKSTAASGSGANAIAEIYYNSINPVVTITNGGSGYTSATAQINGAGTLATASVVVSGGVVTTILINNPGKDYIGGATITINGDGTNATATLTIVPTGIVGNITLVSGQFGTNYTAANIIVHGDGTNATAEVVSITDGAITDINITNRGSNYTTAKVYIIPGTAGTLALPVMAPITGHGRNMAAELAANTVLISNRIDSSVDTDYFVEEDTYGFRQVGLISNLIDNATNDNALKDLYIGPAHPEYSNNNLNKIKRNSGYVLYVNNIVKTLRAENQEEDIKIAISF